MANRNVSDCRFVIPSSTQKSLSLNGTSDNASIPITPSTDGFYCAFWFNKLNVSTAAAEVYVGWGSAGQTTGFQFRHNNSNSKGLFFSIGNGGANFGNNIADASYLVGKWTHVVIQWIPGTNNKQMYINGVLHSQATCASMTAGGTFYLGRNTTGENGKCYIRDFVFKNTTTLLTSTEIQDLYWKNKIPTGATYYSLNNLATDQNGANALTLTGTSYSTSVPPHMAPRTSVSNRFVVATSTQKSLSFNGTSDLATSPITPSASGFGFMMWLYVPAFVNGVFGRVVDWVSGSIGTRVLINGTSRCITFDTGNGSLQSTHVIGSGLSGRWFHYACSFNGVATNKSWQNGIQLTQNSGRSFAQPAGETFTFARSSASAANFGKYLIKNFCSVNTALTTAMVENHMYKNIIPNGGINYSMNNVAADQNGQNSLTLTGTAYSTNIPPHMGVRSVV